MEVFCEKDVLKIFSKLTEIHQRQSLFLIQLQASAQVLCCEFSEISKKTFCYRTPPVAASGD